MSVSKIQSRVIGDYADIKRNGDVLLYPGKLIESLILFDTVVLKHDILSNLSKMVDIFGYEGVLNLIRSGAIEPSIRLGKIAKINKEKSYLEYHFSIISFDEEKEKLSRAVHKDFEEKGIDDSDLQRLIDEACSKLVVASKKSLTSLQEQFKKDITLGDPHVKTAITKISRDKYNKDISEKDIIIEVECMGPSKYEGFTKYEVDTNIPFLLDINLKKTHDLVSRSLLGVAGLNERISEMMDYEAMPGVDNQDYPIFNRKLSFLQDKITPQSQVERWHRVLEIGDFPDVKEATSKGKINLSKVLEIRSTDEVEEFRSWLWSTASLSDAEIRSRVSGFRNRIGQLLQGDKAQTLRWIVTTGAGFIEPVTGVSLGAIDEFVIDKLFPQSGAMMFLNRMYPSIFEKS